MAFISIAAFRCKKFRKSLFRLDWKLILRADFSSELDTVSPIQMLGNAVKTIQSIERVSKREKEIIRFILILIM
jgi:hypothetical protein